MSVINAVAQLLSAGGDYLISRSVRLRSSASAYFSKTFGSAGNRKKWTYSVWIKRGALGTYGALIASKVDGNNYSSLEFSGDELRFVQASGGSITVNKKPAGIFRDPSAWYHIIAVMDTDNATAEDRFIIYKNGERVTVWASNTPPALGLATGYINSTTAQWIGLDANPLYFDGLIADVNFIDGLALPASSFGETDPITGVWKPKKYGGSFGTNGFKLDFSDNSAATAAAIGKDSSGNGNNWTPNNISVTAGVTYDSMLDVPTMWADGGNGRGNYATLNPLQTSSYVTLSNGNLTSTGNTATNSAISMATMDANGQKIYFEAQSNWSIGAITTAIPQTALIDSEANSSNYGFAIRYNGSIYGIAGEVQSVAAFSFVNTDVMGVAIDAVNGAIYISKNGTWLNSGDPTSGSSKTGAFYKWTPSNARSIFPTVNGYNGSFGHANFGQRPFAYTPPTGFKALNTQNLPDGTIKKGNQYFDVSKWTGNGSSQSITNGGFQPDLVWAKDRTVSAIHILSDSVRGTLKHLSSNDTTAEAADDAVRSFDASGFTTGTWLNTSSDAFVGWQWKKGASQGFDIVTYTGNGTNPGRTVAHSLGVTPALIITKSRSGTGEWPSYHKSLPISNTLYLNGIYASSTYLNRFSAVSSTDFTTGSNGSELNTNGVNYVAYLFSEVAGFSKFGSYTGNGSADGPFIYLGFKARYVLYKNASLAGTSWAVLDTARNTYNVMGNRLFAEASSAEDTSVTPFDITANGIKVRSTNDGVNRSGDTIIFAAFAENPFKNSLAR